MIRIIDAGFLWHWSWVVMNMCSSWSPICEANLANRKMQSVQSSCLVRQTYCIPRMTGCHGKELNEHIHGTHEPTKMPIIRWMQEILHQCVDGVYLLIIPSFIVFHSYQYLPVQDGLSIPSITSHTPSLHVKVAGMWGCWAHVKCCQGLRRPTGWWFKCWSFSPIAGINDPHWQIFGDGLKSPVRFLSYIE